MIMTVTADRMQEMLEGLKCWESITRKVSLKQVQSLIGKLSFAAACIPPGRIYYSRMLNYLRLMPKKGKHRTTKSLRLDVKWWLECAERFNGVSLIPQVGWDAPDMVFSSDACLTGGEGAWCGESAFHFQFPEVMLSKGLDINQLECMTVLAALRLWSSNWPRRKILIFCDNLVSIQCINSGWSKDVHLQACLWAIHLITAENSCQVRAIHLKSSQNRAADCLSKWHINDKFQQDFAQWVGPRKFSFKTINETWFNINTLQF